ncbi:unnamed protein product [marine sediment metagenome]|uniref:Serine O-acetyltransferase n=1 Tax=marine sediment metagenome TaxID=412755 RepID=X1PMA0_9ZZZZ
MLMYQGVVLGGTTLREEKSHPTIGNNVVIGTGAVALCAITIGGGARIGSGSVVVKSIPPGVMVVGIPGRVVADRHEPLFDLEHGKLPDPVTETLKLIIEEQDKLKQRVSRLETSRELCSLQVDQKNEKEDKRMKVMITLWLMCCPKGLIR